MRLEQCRRWLYWLKLWHAGDSLICINLHVCRLINNVVKLNFGKPISNVAFHLPPLNFSGDLTWPIIVAASNGTFTQLSVQVQKRRSPVPITFSLRSPLILHDKKFANGACQWIHVCGAGIPGCEFSFKSRSINANTIKWISIQCSSGGSLQIAHASRSSYPYTAFHTRSMCSYFRTLGFYGLQGSLIGCEVSQTWVSVSSIFRIQMWWKLFWLE